MSTSPVQYQTNFALSVLHSQDLLPMIMDHLPLSDTLRMLKIPSFWEISRENFYIRRKICRDLIERVSVIADRIEFVSYKSKVFAKLAVFQYQIDPQGAQLNLQKAAEVASGDADHHNRSIFDVAVIQTEYDPIGTINIAEKLDDEILQPKLYMKIVRKQAQKDLALGYKMAEKMENVMGAFAFIILSAFEKDVEKRREITAVIITQIKQQSRRREKLFLIAMGELSKHDPEGAYTVAQEVKDKKNRDFAFAFIKAMHRKSEIRRMKEVAEAILKISNPLFKINTLLQMLSHQSKIDLKGTMHTLEVIQGLIRQLDSGRSIFNLRLLKKQVHFDLEGVIESLPRIRFQFGFREIFEKVLTKLEDPDRIFSLINEYGCDSNSIYIYIEKMSRINPAYLQRLRDENQFEREFVPVVDAEVALAKARAAFM